MNRCSGLHLTFNARRCCLEISICIGNLRFLYIIRPIIAISYSRSSPFLNAAYFPMIIYEFSQSYWSGTFMKKKNGFSLTNSKSLVPLNYGAMVEGSSFISWSELVQIVRAFSWKAKRGGTSSLGSYGTSVKLTIWTKHKSLNKCSFFYICRSFIPWIYFPFQHTCSAAELGSRFLLILVEYFAP